MKKLILGKALERSLNNAMTFISAVSVLIFIYCNGWELSHSKIFSTIIILDALRTSIVLIGPGIGFYY